MMKMHRIGLILLITFTASPAFAGTQVKAGADAPDYQRLASSLETLKRNMRMPSGLAVAVVDDKRVLYQGNFGYSNISTQLPVSDKTHFYIASTTKSFLALATLLAEERGGLTEATSLAELFPAYDFPNCNAKQVKVRDLLSHTSGIDSPHFTWASSWTGQHTPALRNRFVQTLATDPHSGYSQHRYSNIGYNIMSVWFEHRYKRDWRDTLAEWVLEPLGMNNTTGYVSDITADKREFAQPYSYKYREGKEPVYLRKDDQTMYSVGLISTVNDLTRFLRMQLSGGKLNGKQVFPQKVIETSHQSLTKVQSYYSEYARGWQIRQFEGHKEVFHTGGFPGASALISFIPEQDIAVIVLQNESGLKANLVANYVKDFVYHSHLTKTPDQVELWVKEQLAGLAEQAIAAQAREQQQQQQKESVPIVLSQSKSQYTGTYQHPLAGEIAVSINSQQKIMVQWGNLYGEAFGLEQPDAVNVNFRPGEYIPITFVVEGGKVEELNVNSYLFTKLIGNLEQSAVL